MKTGEKIEWFKEKNLKINCLLLKTETLKKVIKKPKKLNFDTVEQEFVIDLEFGMKLVEKNVDHILVIGLCRDLPFFSKF